MPARAGDIFDEDTDYTPVPEKATRAAIDRAVCAAAADGVHSVVLCPCLIYGRGLGVNPDSLQIPMMLEMARRSGVARHIGAGANIWSNVHIEDCADAYLLALERAPAGAFYYIAADETAMADVARAIGRLLGLGDRAEPVGVFDAADVWPTPFALSMGSNSRVCGDRARAELGWTPRRRPLLDDIEHGSYRAALDA